MGIADSELEDVLQDVFVIAHHRLDRLDPTAKAGTWLFGILRNVVRNRRRGHSRRLRRTEAFAVHVARREQGRHRLERNLGERVLCSELLDGFLVSLDDKQRTVFILAELEGYSGKEIGAALGINPNTAHSRLRLARRAFHDYFGEDEGRALGSVRELREHPESASAELEARGLGMLFSALALPVRETTGLTFGFGGAVKAIALSVVVAAGAVTLHHQATKQTAELPTLAASGHPAGRSGKRHADPSEHPTSEAIVVKAGLSTDVETPPPREEPRPAPPSPRRVQSPAEAPAELLRQARAALVAEQGERALALLDEIPARDSELFEPRVATRIAALCRLGKTQAARVALDELRARAPTSSLIPRLDGACW